MEEDSERELEKKKETCREGGVKEVSSNARETKQEVTVRDHKTRIKKQTKVSRERKCEHIGIYQRKGLHLTHTHTQKETIGEGGPEELSS